MPLNASPRPGQRPSQPRTGIASFERYRRTYRLQVEVLEDRLPLGDTLLGLAVVACGGLDATSAEMPYALAAGMDNAGWRDGLFGSGTAMALRLPLPRNLSSAAAGKMHLDVQAATTPSTETADNVAFLIPVDAGQTAISRLADGTAPWLPTLTGSFGITAGEAGRPWLSSGAISALVTVSGDAGSHALSLFPAAPPLSFDAVSGQLVIQTAAGEYTVREMVAADGFLDVVLDGQDHS